MVKMINFIRAEGKAVGRWPPDLSSKDTFQSEHWLMPQLEDDALLYSLHDIIGDDLDDEMSGMTFRVDQSEVAQPQRRDYHLSTDPRPDNPIYRIAEMERRVESAQRDLQQHRQLLASDMQLHGRLGHGLAGEEPALEVPDSPQQTDAFETEMAPNGDTSKLNGNTDSSYFASYSGHGIFFFCSYAMANADIDRHP